jgi:hypothetical protein
MGCPKPHGWLSALSLSWHITTFIFDMLWSFFDPQGLNCALAHYPLGQNIYAKPDKNMFMIHKDDPTVINHHLRYHHSLIQTDFLAQQL